MGLVFVVNTFVVKAIVTDEREPGSSLPTLTFAPGKCCLCVLRLSIHCCESAACSLKGGILSASVIAPSSSSLLFPGTRRTHCQSLSSPKSLLEQHHHLPHICPGVPNSSRVGLYGQPKILSLSIAVALVKYAIF